MRHQSCTCCAHLASSIPLPCAACQSDMGLQHALHQTLARCGGAALKAELLELAERLAATAALTEAVHGRMYQQLLTGLI